MIKQIFIYIVKREAYSGYLSLKNSTVDVQLSVLNKTMKTLVYSLWSLVCLYLMYKLGVVSGLLIFIIPVAFIKCISALYLLTKRSIPIYSEKAVFKSDRRYKGGTRISHYDRFVSGYRPLTSDEKDQVNKIFKYKISIWSAVLVLSLTMLYFKQ